MDLTRITVLGFTACYVVALALEVWSLVRRFGWHRPVLLVFAAAGGIAQATYLVVQAQRQATPLSSPADWCLLAALVLAAMYIASAFTWPRLSTGLFLLPVVLGLIAFSQVASDAPIAGAQTTGAWGQIHAWLLILATVTVTLGFLAGMMYLIQSWRLKHKLPRAKGFRLPSLETLERINGRALAFSAWLVAGGFFSGIVLTLRRHQGQRNYDLWTDPVVICLAVMLAWLVAAEIFRMVYPAARRGRKVAYLTLASFVFLVITIASMILVSDVHRPAPLDRAASQATSHKPPITVFPSA